MAIWRGPSWYQRRQRPRHRIRGPGFGPMVAELSYTRFSTLISTLGHFTNSILQRCISLAPTEISFSMMTLSTLHATNSSRRQQKMVFLDHHQVGLATSEKNLMSMQVMRKWWLDVQMGVFSELFSYFFGFFLLMDFGGGADVIFY